jgi:hypothetical protein
MSRSGSEDKEYRTAMPKAVEAAGISLVEKSAVEKLRADLGELPSEFQQRARDTLEYYGMYCRRYFDRTH